VNSTHTSRRRFTAGATVALVFAALVLAAIETLGSSTRAPRGERTVGVSLSVTSRADTDQPAPSVPFVSEPTTTAAPAHLPHLPSGPGAVHALLATPGAGSASDPHRLVSPTSHGGNPVLLPPDSTPLAAAAGTEPGSMEPVTGLPAGWVSSVHRLTVAGMIRSYLLVRPPATAGGAKLAVVMVLHGRGLTPAGIERLTHMPAATGPAILVYPAGYGRSWDAGGCCGVAHAAKVDDVTFLTDTIHQVLAGQHDASPSRVYIIGYSNGGRMAYRMACTDPGVFAGIAAVEAVPVAPCAATTAVPTIIVASSHDPLLTIDNGHRLKVMQGYVEPTVQTTVDEWRQLDGCAALGATSVTGVATVDTWGSCRGAGRVAYALYAGGSHAWPAGTEGVSGTPSAEDLVWAWMTRGVVITAAAA
jgi:polyhydroxybutyrate depolymerase